MTNAGRASESKKPGRLCERKPAQGDLDLGPSSGERGPRRHRSGESRNVETAEKSQGLYAPTQRLHTSTHYHSRWADPGSWDGGRASLSLLLRDTTQRKRADRHLVTLHTQPSIRNRMAENRDFCLLSRRVLPATRGTYASFRPLSVTIVRCPPKFCG